MVKVVNFCYVSFTCPSPATNTQISLFSGANMSNTCVLSFPLLVSDLTNSVVPEIAAFLALQS